MLKLLPLVLGLALQSSARAQAQIDSPSREMNSSRSPIARDRRHTGRSQAVALNGKWGTSDSR
jgi:hypothetical protein